MNEAVLIITITDRNRGGEFAAWYQSQGIPLVLTALGRGTATTEILDYLGLEATEKSVLLCAPPSWCIKRKRNCGWISLAGAS